MTRSLNGPVAKHFATLPRVQVVEKNWVEITVEWLQEQKVGRAFIASHNQPNQFAEESKFHLAALNAGVQYVVRISTTAANVRPNCEAYYPRNHWAIEALLGTPEFSSLQWTSLQANVFSNFWLATAAEFIKQYRKTGKQDTLRLMASEDGPVGIVDADDVGHCAAHLLLQDDVSPHHKARYVLNGPLDITGRQIVELVEEHIGTRVDSVSFKDMSFIDHMAAASQETKSVMLSIKHALVTAWDGKCTASTASEAVLKLAAPTRTPTEVLKAMLEVQSETDQSLAPCCPTFNTTNFRFVIAIEPLIIVMSRWHNILCTVPDVQVPLDTNSLFCRACGAMPDLDELSAIVALDA